MARKTGVIDPAVLAVMTDAAKRDRQRHMSPAKRARARADEQRSKATYDLPPWLIEAISELAEQERCSTASVAAFLLVRGLEAYRRGDFDFEGYYRVSRSPRCDFVLDVPEVEATESDDS